MLQFDIGKKLPLADSSLTNFVQKTINKYRQETYKAEELKDSTTPRTLQFLQSRMFLAYCVQVLVNMRPQKCLIFI